MLFTLKLRFLCQNSKEQNLWNLTKPKTGTISKASESKKHTEQKLQNAAKHNESRN